MSRLTLSQMRTSVTRSTATTELLAILTELGFPTAHWQTGSVPRMILEMCAYVVSRFASYISSLTFEIFNETATGTWLTRLSASHYDNTRVASVAATYTVQLTGGAVGPPYSITVGQLVATDGTRTFRNTTGGTLNASDTLDLTFDAEVAGADGNVTPATIDTLNTPLAGVTVAGTAAITAGADAESDVVLRARNRTKWATLAIEVTEDGIENEITTAVAGITRVYSDATNPRGAGTVDVYCASASGAAAGGDVTSAITALEARVMGTVGASGSSEDYEVIAATEQAITITGTVYYDSSYTEAIVSTAVDTAVAAYVNAAPIGGYDYSPGPSGVILMNDIVAAIEGAAGVINVNLTAPTSNIALTGSEYVATIATPIGGLSYTSVTLS